MSFLFDLRCFHIASMWFPCDVVWFLHGFLWFHVVLCGFAWLLCGFMRFLCCSMSFLCGFMRFLCTGSLMLFLYDFMWFLWGGLYRECRNTGEPGPREYFDFWAREYFDRRGLFRPCSILTERAQANLILGSLIVSKSVFWPASMLTFPVQGVQNVRKTFEQIAM